MHEPKAIEAFLYTTERRVYGWAMNLLFLPFSTPPERARPPDLGVDLSVLRRHFRVALAAALAGLLHGGVLFWVLERPVPAPLTQAMPLPFIELLLSAPSPPAPLQPVEPAKQLPKKKPKMVQKIKTKTKPRPEKADIAQEQSREEIQEASSAAPAPPALARAEAASPRAETYTPASTHANYLNNPRPIYPSVARRRHWEGLLYLRVFVTPEGHCGKVSVNRSSGHEVLDKAALEAVRKWRFVPAKRGNIAQASWVTVPIEFELR